MMGIPIILESFAILYLKSKKDMIMELSKLDYLLVVSVFQKPRKQ